MFAAVRHPDIEALGVIPQGAYEMHRARGWVRVSDWVDDPAELHLPDYADAADLDAPAPEPSEPARPADQPETEE